ncbi:MarR family winged helix-turn-helix transcriptional regulator [Xanthobacter sp. TB0139]|uniref:MarR family winged helix-turn-helix transcriptional regulator n=1 Tax=Xanthobacter sp. TB0139 TaxID=3459178 RepID=UPI00403A2EF1
MEPKHPHTHPTLTTEAGQEPPMLGFMLVEAARLYRARMDLVFERAGLGLTAGEARTLVYVNRYPGLRQCVLAEKMNVEPMTLVGFLDKLEKRDLVARQVDPRDRRAKVVTLTPAARPYLEQVLDMTTSARAEALEGLSPADQDMLVRILQQISGNLARPARERARS